MEHIKTAKLKEKQKDLKEIDQETINRVMAIQEEIQDVFAKHECTVQESYTILLAMTESILQYTILKELGYEK